MLFHGSTALALVGLVSGHTVFTNVFINGENQGDGTCVRMPLDSNMATNPLEDLSSDDMACSRDGATAVAYTCPAPAGSKLTFWYRETPDFSEAGSIDISHKGPCSVYIKQVSSMEQDSAAGSGWFKIWHQGYNTTSGKWCTEDLIANNGLLSIDLPSGLPGGYYLVRPELLALHEAYIGDPQFYSGCAQIYVESPITGTLEIPTANQAIIPGYVKAGDASVSFNIWIPKWPYTMPGPEPFVPTAPNTTTISIVQAQTDGVIPSDCLIKNANWCGVEVPSYTTEAGCWAASANCYTQEAACYASAPPSGSQNCDVWDTKCQTIQNACNAKQFSGPPNKDQKLTSESPAAPGPIPDAVAVADGTLVQAATIVGRSLSDEAPSAHESKQPAAMLRARRSRLMARNARRQD